MHLVALSASNLSPAFAQFKEILGHHFTYLFENAPSKNESATTINLFLLLQHHSKEEAMRIWCIIALSPSNLSPAFAPFKETLGCLPSLSLCTFPAFVAFQISTFAQFLIFLSWKHLARLISLIYSCAFQSFAAIFSVLADCKTYLQLFPFYWFVFEILLGLLLGLLFPSHS